MIDDIGRLQDILLSINKIEKYAQRGRKIFENDELIQTFFTHHLQIIGEACRALSKELHEKYPEIDWHQIVGMRNVIVHKYLDVDLDEVWNTITKDLPKFREQVLRILRDSKS